MNFMPFEPHLFNSIDLIHFAFTTEQNQHIILPKFLMASLPPYGTAHPDPKIFFFKILY